MRAAAAASASWCSSWDEASDALLRLLGGELDVDGVHALLRTRQRLMTAHPMPTTGRSPETQRAWLEKAEAREVQIREAFEAYRVRVGTARQAMQASQATRRRFQAGDEISPAAKLDRHI